MTGAVLIIAARQSITNEHHIRSRYCFGATALGAAVAAAGAVAGAGAAGVTADLAAALALAIAPAAAAFASDAFFATPARLRQNGFVTVPAALALAGTIQSHAFASALHVVSSRPRHGVTAAFAAPTVFEAAEGAVAAAGAAVAALGAAGATGAVVV